MTPPPLLLLDVDGVLNALGNGPPDPAVWPQWQQGRATSEGIAWPIVFAPEVMQRLSAWHRDGRVELQWLTTWGDDANGELRVLLRMPHLVVAGTHRERTHGGAAATGATAHAAVAPSAPNPLSGRWWKHDVVQRVVAQQPDRLIVWVDDELRPPEGAVRVWAESQPMVRAVGPDPRWGLTAADIASIAHYLGVAA